MDLCNLHNSDNVYVTNPNCSMYVLVQCTFNMYNSHVHRIGSTFVQFTFDMQGTVDISKYVYRIEACLFYMPDIRIRSSRKKLPLFFLHSKKYIIIKMKSQRKRKYIKILRIIHNIRMHISYHNVACISSPAIQSAVDLTPFLMKKY